MAVEVTSLALNVKSDSVEKGADRLDHLSKASTKADKSTTRLNTTTKKGSATMGKSATVTKTATKSTAGLAKAQLGATATTKGLSTATASFSATVKSALGPLLALIGPVLILKKAFSTSVELQDFEAQLKTATGSVEEAAAAFELLEGFASETPFALEQSLEAFIKLTNLGLTPSEEALRSYGNTASAMGKDLNQMIEAVADATTGEFERLKEFGIKSKSEGDNVSFTFRGITTTVKKNAEEIEGYLMALGENEFAGAMADRMDTLGGKVSNLGDTFNKLFRNISESGVDTIFAASVDNAIDLLNEMNTILESGQFEAELKSWTIGIEGWGRSFADTLDIINGLLNDNAEETDSWFTEFMNGIKMLPSFLHLMVKTFGEFAIALSTSIGAVKDSLDGEKSLTSAIETAKAAFEEMHRTTQENIEVFEKETIAIENTSKAARSAREEYDKLTAAKKNSREMDMLLDDIFEEVTGQKPGATEKPKTATGTTTTSIADATGLTQDVDYTERIDAYKGYWEELVIVTEKGAERIKLVEHDLEAERQKIQEERVTATGNVFMALADLERGRSEESQRRQKAFAIAAATINTYQGATAAYNDPTITSTYGKIAAAAVVVASGLAYVDSIRSAGNFATGGIIPGSSFAGDQVVANVNSGEMILNTAQQSRLFDMANNGGTSMGTSGIANVTIINQTRTPVEAEARTDENGNFEIIVREAVTRTKQELTNEANVGGGEFVPAMAQNFNLSRAGQ